MREVTRHKVQNEANEQLTIASVDLPTGEPVIYSIRIPHGPDVALNFQNGPIGEVGVNGLTNEALLAIVMDRLAYFQEGKYKCRENALAATKIEEALMWLHARTMGRLQRGVEGTHIV